jgi:hypothetical protein
VVLDHAVSEKKSTRSILTVGRFYKDDKGCAVLLENRFSHEWAEAAGGMVFPKIEFPREENLVVFLNLALFWYSIGEFQRSNMHAGRPPLGATGMTH